MFAATPRCNARQTFVDQQTRNQRSGEIEDWILHKFRRI
jgi:hypothetical protein